MGDYERSALVPADPDRVFGYVSDPMNMPNYIATMTSVQREGDGLRVAAMVEGRGLEEGPATFDVDAVSRSISWGQADSEYHGALNVAAENGQSRVTIRLHTLDDSDAAQTEQALRDTMDNISRAM
jgi:carbon monoxide dehydrogenase subunit G